VLRLFSWTEDSNFSLLKFQKRSRSHTVFWLEPFNVAFNKKGSRVTHNFAICCFSCCCCCFVLFFPDVVEISSKLLKQVLDHWNLYIRRKTLSTVYDVTAIYLLKLLRRQMGECKDLFCVSGDKCEKQEIQEKVSIWWSQHGELSAASHYASSGLFCSSGGDHITLAACYTVHTLLWTIKKVV